MSRLEALLDDHLDGRLDDAGRAAFLAELQTPEARRDLYRLMLLHAGLSAQLAPVGMRRPLRAGRWSMRRRAGAAAGWLAAAVLIFVCGVLVGVQLRTDGGPAATPEGTTQAGKPASDVLNGPRRIDLADGSTIDLHDGAALRLDPGGDPAVHMLRGTAQVHALVRPDGHPLGFGTPHGSVTAAGTQFSVHAEAESSYVTVAEGRVRVLGTQGGPALDIAAGGEGRLATGAAPAMVHPRWEAMLAGHPASGWLGEPRPDGLGMVLDPKARGTAWVISTPWSDGQGWFTLSAGTELRIAFSSLKSTRLVATLVVWEPARPYAWLANLQAGCDVTAGRDQVLRIPWRSLRSVEGSQPEDVIGKVVAKWVLLSSLPEAEVVVQRMQAVEIR